MPTTECTSAGKGASTYEGASANEAPRACKRASEAIARSPKSVDPNAVGVIVTSSPRIARIRRCVYWGRWRGIISRAHAYANSDSDPLRVGGTGAEEQSHKHESAC